MPKKAELVQTLVQKFYSDSSDGLRVATMSRWPGRMILGPRTRLNDALGLMGSLLESTTATTIPGVYFLTRKAPQTLYIGQSRALRARIRTHHANRPDWEQFAIAFCTDTRLQLTTADTSYLEWKLIEQATKVKQIELKNQQNPSPPYVDEEKKPDLDGWFDGVLQISSLLGMKYFVDKAQQDTSSVSDSPTVFEMRFRGGQAQAMHGGGGFVVLKNSLATGEWRARSGVGEHIKTLLLKLMNDGTLARDTNGDLYRFTRDHEFNSPSLAASIIIGNHDSGPRRWKVKGTDTTYKEWQSGANEQGSAG